MNAPLVSTILTVYNGEKFLREAIESVLNQTHPNIQFIIVDDGSTDATADIVRSYNDPRIEFYQLEENRHIAYATNTGFHKVRGDYVAIIDADDIWAKTKLEKQLDYLSSHPEHSGCFTWVDLIDENGTLINEQLPWLRELFACSTDTQEDWLRYFFFHGNRLNNPSSLVKADTLKVVGEHSLFYIQAIDMEWWVRFTQHFSFGILEEPLVRYRRILTSDSSVSSLSERNNARFFNEYMHIRYHFFDTMEDELFLRTFREYFRRPDAATPEELSCEKAFLLIDSHNNSTAYNALGLVKLEKLLSDPKTAEVLKEKYHFTTRDCGMYTGSHLYNDPYLQDAVKNLDTLSKEKEQLTHDLYHTTLHNTQLKERLHNTEESLDELNTTLRTITNSTIWKMTAPLRALLDKFH